jgi:predicted Rossmann fold nucleotide-binding protein DprA/Smf involved in DNA uptake
MQRNKIIYALADAALVVCSDHGKGGTWTGAVEQLDKLGLVPVYVRSNGTSDKALSALVGKGALPWPNPRDSEALMNTITAPVRRDLPVGGQANLPLDSPSCSSDSTSLEAKVKPLPMREMRSSQSTAMSQSPAEELFAKVRELVIRTKTPVTETEMAETLQVSKRQAKTWLQRLADEGLIEKLSKPTRYQRVCSLGPLFEK